MCSGSYGPWKSWEIFEALEIPGKALDFFY